MFINDNNSKVNNHDNDNDNDVAAELPPLRFSQRGPRIRALQVRA